MVAVGIFAEEDKLEGFSRYSGIVHGGGFYLLGVQVELIIKNALFAATFKSFFFFYKCNLFHRKK